MIAMLGVAVMAGAPSLALAGGGQIDATFGEGGVVRTSFDSDHAAIGADLAVQPDGKIVVVGSRPGVGGVVLRYERDGDLDPTFDDDGVVFLNLGYETHLTDVAVQEDGKIAIAGIVGLIDNDVLDLLVVRLGSNGSPDPTFGGDGIVSTPITEDSQASAIAIQPDGRVVLAGSVVSGSVDFVVARYLTDGSLDPSFNSTGYRLIDFGPGNEDEARDVAIQPDGRIVIAGRSGDDSRIRFAIARVTGAGALDMTFSGDGLRTVNVAPFSSQSEAVAIDGDNRLVVAGTASASPNEFRPALVRLRPGGTLDPTFADGGVRTIETDAIGLAHDVLVLPRGRIVIAGEASTDVMLVRLRPSGALNSSFGPGGIVITDLGASEGANGVARTPGGKLVITGWADDFRSVLVARYISR
jgi:uncharacterized delta-60 repeat protein